MRVTTSLAMMFPGYTYAEESANPLDIPTTKVTSLSLSKVKKDSQENWSATADAPIENTSGNHKSPANPKDAAPMGGVADTWAPGGSGARVSMHVQGTSNTVNRVNLGYWAGWVRLGNNACVDDFEVAFYDGFNNRQVLNKNHYSCLAPFTAANQWFDINQYLHSYTPICGRVKVNNQWSPYACLQIIP